MTISHKKEISRLVMMCREERDVDRKIELYNEIRKKIQDPNILKLPSMITDDYIDSSLDRI